LLLNLRGHFQERPLFTLQDLDFFPPSKTNTFFQTNDSEHDLGNILYEMMLANESKSECNIVGLRIIRVCMKILLIFKVEVIGTPIIDIRLP